MNNPNTKSTVFNIEGATAATIMWILAILVSFTRVSFVIVIISILILLNEKSSDFFRNHVSQLLSLSIIYTLIDIIFIVLFGSSSIFFFKVIIVITAFVSNILRIVLSLLKASFCLMGLSRAMDKRDLSLPFFSNFAEGLERSITPES